MNPVSDLCRRPVVRGGDAALATAPRPEPDLTYLPIPMAYVPACQVSVNSGDAVTTSTAMA